MGYACCVDFGLPFSQKPKAISQKPPNLLSENKAARHQATLSRCLEEGHLGGHFRREMFHWFSQPMSPHAASPAGAEAKEETAGGYFTGGQAKEDQSEKAGGIKPCGRAKCPPTR